MQRTVRRLLTLLGVALWAGSAAVQAQPGAGQREPGRRGAMSPAELRREPIRFELDVPYAATDTVRQRLDLYLPKAPATERLPVIVFIHGGGWRQGDKADGAGRLMPYVRGGDYAGVSVGYRLTSEATWPAQLHDCKAAIRWVRAHADRYGLDPERIGAWGRSAGAHLALMLGVTGDAPDLEGNLGPHTGTSSRVACVVNHFGVTDLSAGLGRKDAADRGGRDAPATLLLGGPLHDRPEEAKSASPVTHISPGDPPVLTAHGTADRTVPYSQAVRLDAALRQAGVPSELITIQDAGHGELPPVVDDRTAAFLAKHLLGP